MPVEIDNIGSTTGQGGGFLISQNSSSMYNCYDKDVALLSPDIINTVKLTCMSKQLAI